MAAAAITGMAGAPPLLAHKPITSKYTYNEHVFPIFRDRCGGCHVEGGAAPMSLMTYRDAYPWAESIRAEVVAGHMPPGSADAGTAPFMNARTLSPRELDTLVTWATGGTPEGPASARPSPVALERRWALGEPDLVLPLPESTTLPAGEMTAVRDFVLPIEALDRRAIRAIDLMPENGAMVRRAVFSVHEPSGGATPASHPAARERVVAIWEPDGETIPAPDGTGFVAPPGGAIAVRITFRKTWRFENQSMSDRSRIGLYFASTGAARPIEALQIAGGSPASIDGDVDVLALRIEATDADVPIAVDAARPDGTRVPLLRGTTAPEWPRRYWFEHPVPLPRGTRIEATAGSGDSPRIHVICEATRR